MRMLLPAALILLAAPLVAGAAPIVGNLDVTGTEPFWSARIRPGYIRWRSADEDRPVVYRGVSRASSAGWTILRARHGRERIEIRLRRNPKCDDGMSDRYYPYDAWIFFGTTPKADGHHLEGCAYPAGRVPPDIVYDP